MELIKKELVQAIGETNKFNNEEVYLIKDKFIIEEILKDNIAVLKYQDTLNYKFEIPINLID